MPTDVYKVLLRDYYRMRGDQHLVWTRLALLALFTPLLLDDDASISFRLLINITSPTTPPFKDNSRSQHFRSAEGAL